MIYYAHGIILPLPPPPNPQIKCDGCGTSFDIRQTLIFRKWGRAIVHHNEVYDKLIDLSWRASPSVSVRSKPLTHQDCNISERGIYQGSEKFYTRGDVMIRGLWNWQTDPIIDVKLGDANTDTYRFKPMSAILARWEKIKKDKYGTHFHDQRKFCVRFFFLLMEC